MSGPDLHGAAGPPSGARPQVLAQRDQAFYLFALIDGTAVYRALEGTNDQFPQPTLHRAGPIAALIDIVPLSDYCGTDAALHLSDLAWLAPRTVHHAAVLRRAMDCSPVYPVPFATLFASCDTLTAFMRAHAGTIGEFFRTVNGAAEWELKASASVDSSDALEALARATWPDWAQLSPGTRYLRLCRDRPGLVTARRAAVQELAAGLAERLLPPAKSLRRLVLRPAADDGGELVGSFALLVPLGDANALACRVEELADEAAGSGIALSLSGPWPPFSFRPDLPRPPQPPAATD